MNPSQIWQDLCGLVIRPQRCQYEPSLALGPKIFQLADKIYERKDFELHNPRGHKLQCSHYQPTEKQRKAERLPCVIYCHGNCGSRCDALDAVQVLLPYNITVLAFDFSGSGLSEGEYVSLGFYEKQDLATIVEYLWSTKRVSRIGLWGRSMGAATSVMYASVDPSIAGIVLDSPFKTLEDVIFDLVESYQRWVPKMAVRVAIRALRNTIQTKAQFDIKKLCPLIEAKKAFVPALFAHAEGDNFIKISHSEAIYAAYNGDKNLIRFDGDHNSERPDFFFDSVSIFFYNCLIKNDPLLDPDLSPVNLGSAIAATSSSSSSSVATAAAAVKESDESNNEMISPLPQRGRSASSPQIVLSGSFADDQTPSRRPTTSSGRGRSRATSTVDHVVDQDFVQAMILSLQDALIECEDEEERKKLEARLTSLQTTGRDLNV